MRFIEPAADAEPLPTLEQWRAAPEPKPAAVSVPNSVDPQELAAELPRLRTVALQFPKWTDGRAYSQAHLLRARLRYAGEIRATGEVLADMLPLLRRTGFDAVELRADQDRQTAERALGFFDDGHYQGDVVEPRPWFVRRAAERVQW